MIVDINFYTGKRYGFMTYNCWQHVVAVRKAAGIKTKMYTVASMAAGVVASKFNTERTRNEHGLILVTEPKNFDIVIFKRPVAGIDYYHAGIWFNGWVSHSCNIAEQVIFEPLREAIKNRREVELWR